MKATGLAALAAATLVVVVTACANGPGRPMSDPSAVPPAPASNAMPGPATTTGEAMMNGQPADGAMMNDHPAGATPEAMDSMGEDAEPMMQGGETMTQPDAMVTRPDGTRGGEGTANNTEAMMGEPRERYTEYGSEALAKATRNGRAVLFFRADWCPTCKAADAEFRANLDNIPADVTVLALNYDKESALKKRYNVTYQHTFIQVDGAGTPLGRWSGGGIAELLANLK